MKLLLFLLFGSYLSCVDGFIASCIDRTNVMSYRNTRSQLALLKNPFSKATQGAEILEEDSGELVLSNLGLKSNTEPKKFEVDPKRALDIASATLPVRQLFFVTKRF